jgi:hypothetical protein
MHRSLYYLQVAIAGMCMVACTKPAVDIQQTEFEKAKKVFFIGMSMDDALAQFGKPTSIDHLDKQTVWTYPPLSTTAPQEVRHLAGFEIVFDGGKGKEIRAIDMYISSGKK